VTNSIQFLIQVATSSHSSQPIADLISTINLG
jgi:hypothetical protein